MYEFLKKKCDEIAARMWVTVIALMQYAFRDESHDCDLGLYTYQLVSVFTSKQTFINTLHLLNCILTLLLFMLYVNINKNEMSPSKCCVCGRA